MRESWSIHITIGAHMKNYWIKASAILASILAMSLTAGCASSIDKVVEDRGQDMESIYAHYAGGDKANNYERRKRTLNMRDAESRSAMTGFPPHPERVRHLFPKLPNPELFMFVRPHAVGASGAPIPAYITRFTMYEKTHYALPGETVDTIRRNAVIDEALDQQDRERAAQLEDEQLKAQRKREQDARTQAFRASAHKKR
ncbi:hypothetical protein MARGE09_P1958 [Marinagarivorans cellulosilyticus]|uniref:Lipoprotein n=2 Tax=Marinagarivorans cellulosilyticus TaxID=2721545 RepID=A0AAN2BK96_9GAMM|nr:hypothetical protein MARGE09_P1958 [Marinagarivorans cellulosilyticus]